MNKLIYTIEQIYNDDNIYNKPYPFCPKCSKKINIQITDTYNIEPLYEITCTCKNFVWIYNKDINKLCELWNKYCIENINDKFINIINNNILLTEIGLISNFLLFIYFINMPQLLPLLTLIIYSPTLLQYILDNRGCKYLINKYIINKSINSQLLKSNLNKKDINIQKEVNMIYNLEKVINNFKSYYHIPEINDIILINQQIYQYYINHYKDISNEYLDQLNKFNNMLLIINKEKMRAEEIKNNSDIKKLIHSFQIYFNIKLNEINELKINNLNNILSKI